ncbi:MAG: hypothetical protein PHS79_04000 [Patescibacteria group bacterium]|nr:hypothetical protein [Patescibacteria group bacterium]
MSITIQFKDLLRHAKHLDVIGLEERRLLNSIEVSERDRMRALDETTISFAVDDGQRMNVAFAGVVSTMPSRRSQSHSPDPPDKNS